MENRLGLINVEGPHPGRDRKRQQMKKAILSVASLVGDAAALEFDRFVRALSMPQRRVTRTDTHSWGDRRTSFT
jgi:hypothetical protein